MDLALELGCFIIVAYDLYYRAARGHAQLRKQIAHQLHVAVVDTVETHRIHPVDNDYSLYHLCSFSLSRVKFKHTPLIKCHKVNICFLHCQSPWRLSPRTHPRL